MAFLQEWAPAEGVLMALPDSNTDWDYIIDEAREQYHKIIKCFTDNKVPVYLICQSKKEASALLSDCNRDFIFYLETDYNDTWTRDYGPVPVIFDNDFSAFDFGFNGWGLKFAADKDNTVILRLKKEGIFHENKIKDHRDFVLEGGSIESDGEGVILTTSRCLCSLNRNGGLNEIEVSAKLKEFFDAKKILFLHHGFLEGDDTDSHIDTLARFLPGRKITFIESDDKEDLHYEELQKMKEELSSFTDVSGNNYTLVPLPLPDPIYDENGLRLPATYSNFLIFNDLLFMPLYNQPEKDKKALEIMKKNCPDKKIIGIDCTTLIKQHGSLHCATMQLPEGLINKKFLNDFRKGTGINV